MSCLHANSDCAKLLQLLDFWWCPQVNDGDEGELVIETQTVGEFSAQDGICVHSISDQS